MFEYVYECLNVQFTLDIVGSTQSIGVNAEKNALIFLLLYNFAIISYPYYCTLFCMSKKTLAVICAFICIHMPHVRAGVNCMAWVIFSCQ